MDPVLIVGAGMAGLACARTLHRAGRPFLLLEASENVGGRVRTDVTPQGFILDHGFQVLLSAYPEVRRQLDLPALSPRSFRSGAWIRLPDGRETLLRDPLRDIWALPAALLSPMGSFADKLRIVALVWEVLRSSPDALLAREEGETIEFLRVRGFSEQCLANFFIPFFGGVFLDRSLSTQSAFFLFVFQQFVLGRAVLPKGGMRGIPLQLAAPLPEGSVRLSTPVRGVSQSSVELSSGETLAGSAVVLAVDGAAANRLLPGLRAPEAWRHTRCAYFAAPGKPGKGDGYLRLNASPVALVHNVCFPSDVAPDFAPEGYSLVSVSSHGGVGGSRESWLTQVRAELESWFGTQVAHWRHLGTYDLPAALPVGPIQVPRARHHAGVLVCGDHAAYPSLNAALASGRLAAEALL